MERRAVVIKIIGDEELGNAVASGMARSVVTPTSEELEIVKAEFKRLKEEHKQLEARYGVRTYVDEVEWEKTRRELARKYQVKPIKGLHRIILVTYVTAYYILKAIFSKEPIVI